MLNDGFRVRAAPDKRHRDKPAQGKSNSFESSAFPEPLHPANRAAHFMTGIEPVNHRSRMRVRSASAHGRLY
jgi:hypothetical protein